MVETRSPQVAVLPSSPCDGESFARGLASLRRKYERMLALREAHDRARTDPSFVEADPKSALAALAEEFPGALREIDRLALDIIRTRIAALAEAEHEPTRVARWMEAQILAHRLARGVLTAKRWLAGRRAIDERIREAFQSAGLGPDAAVFDLDVIANPPRGRLMHVVRAEVARRLALSEREVDGLLR